MAEKKSPTKEIVEVNESNLYNMKKIDDLTTDAQKALMQNVESLLEDFGPVNDSTDPEEEEIIKNLKKYRDDLKNAEKRALSDEEKLSTNQKRRKFDYFNIEDDPIQVVGGTKNKNILSSNAYDSLSAEKNSSMAQEPFNSKHVATCSSTEQPTTSHTLSGQLPQPPSIPSSSQPSFNPKLVQTCSDAEQPPQPHALPSTSQGTRSVSSLR